MTMESRGVSRPNGFAWVDVWAEEDRERKRESRIIMMESFA